jgi:hypothetical protein
MLGIRPFFLIRLQVSWGVDMTGLVSRILNGVVMGRRGREAASTVNPADIRRLPSGLGSAARIGFVGSWLILGSGIPFLHTTRTA